MDWSTAIATGHGADTPEQAEGRMVLSAWRMAAGLGLPPTHGSGPDDGALALLDRPVAPAAPPVAPPAQPPAPAAYGAPPGIGRAAEPLSARPDHPCLLHRRPRWHRPLSARHWGHPGGGSACAAGSDWRPPSAGSATSGSWSSSSPDGRCGARASPSTRRRSPWEASSKRACTRRRPRPTRLPPSSPPASAAATEGGVGGGAPADPGHRGRPVRGAGDGRRGPGQGARPLRGDVHAGPGRQRGHRRPPHHLRRSVQCARPTDARRPHRPHLVVGHPSRLRRERGAHRGGAQRRGGARITSGTTASPSRRATRSSRPRNAWWWWPSSAPRPRRPRPRSREGRPDRDGSRQAAGWAGTWPTCPPPWPCWP